MAIVLCVASYVSMHLRMAKSLVLPMERPLDWLVARHAMMLGSRIGFKAAKKEIDVSGKNSNVMGSRAKPGPSKTSGTKE